MPMKTLNDYFVTVELTDISTASSAYAVCPDGGTIVQIDSILHGTIATANDAVTCKVGATAITNGVLTVAYSGSAAGDIDTVYPTAANVVTSGGYVAVATDGASTNAIRLTVTFRIRR